MGLSIWGVITDADGITHYVPLNAVDRFTVEPPRQADGEPMTVLGLRSGWAIRIGAPPHEVFQAVAAQLAELGEDFAPIYWPPEEEP